jgi:hypothetical protein
VDDEDFEELSKFKWYANPRGYVLRNVPRAENNGVRGMEYMHRRVKGLRAGDGLDIDHIDGNKLNNQGGNLRIATHAQNLRNKRKTKQNKSGFKGVSFCKKTMKWRSLIDASGKQYLLGYFNTPEAAHNAYKAAAERLHGEFANFG